METGSLSTVPASGILAPASAVRAVEGQPEPSQHAANPEAQPKARRRPARQGDEDRVDDLSSAPEADEQPAHQFDDMA